METQLTRQLFLRVNNPQVLEHGSLPSFSPYDEITTIGSGAADWRLYDAAGSVGSLHAQIMRHDGQFILADMCGRTYINHHQDPLGMFKVVALKDMDMIRIGKYQISVNIGEQDAASAYNVKHLRELEVNELLGAGSKDNWLFDKSPSVTGGKEIYFNKTENGLQKFLESKMSSMEADPLRLLNVERKPDQVEQIVSSSVVDITTDAAESIVFDYTGTTRESVSQPKDQAGVEVMTTDIQKNQQSVSDTQPVDHIVSAPLINSLGIQIEEMGAEQAHFFLSQVGHALQKAIQGLLILYQADKESKLDLSLLGRSYQAIEDNPLRMGMSYEETARALLSPNKSRVHLSAEHAIEESMQNIKESQKALIEAIQESLRQLMQAFSPKHLEKRFSHYRGEQNIELDDDAWKWRMYGDYFEEMTSSRQTGLEKMFWEIFEQSYDRKMRRVDNGGAS